MNDVSLATASGIDDLLLAVELDPSCAETYEAIADQLMVKGYGAEAARWRSWSLLQPSSSNLNQAIAKLRELSLGRPSLLDKTAQILDQAQQLYSQGFLQQAKDLLESLAFTNSLPPAICNRVGMLEAQLGDHWRAESWYRTSLLQQAAQPQVWFAITRLLLNQSSWDEAIETVEQGLIFSPKHPWGLKLRIQALQLSKGWRTLALLDSKNELPKSDQRHGPLTAGRSFRYNKIWLQLDLQEKLRLRHLLINQPACWWALNFRQADLLLWAKEQELLPNNLSIKIIASPDPLGLHSDLNKLDDLTISMGSSYGLDNEIAPGLLILARGPLRALPRAIAPWLNNESIPLLAPIGLLNKPPARKIVFGAGGWELWWPNSSDE